MISPGTLKENARSSKQSRDLVETQAIRKILAGMVIAIRVAKITRKSTGVIEQLWMVGKQSHSINLERGQQPTINGWKLPTRLGS
jgi:hypothetical protein